MRTRPIVLPAFAAVILSVTSACGSGTPSLSQPPNATLTPPSASPSASDPSAVPAAAADWLGFRGDASHSGVAAAGPVGRPVVAWQYHAKAAVPHAISIVGDQVSFASEDGSVYALDRASGTERWVVNVGRGPIVGPWAADGRLYLLDGAGHVLALDAATGKTIWTSATTYDRATEPVVADGAVYFGTGDGRLVAVDGVTGTERWAIKPSPSTEWIGNPAVANGHVYAGTSDGFISVDVATHQVAWTGDTHRDQTGSAAVGEGVAFIASGADASSVPARAFDAATGALRWTAQQPGLTFPVAADGMAFSSTMDGLVDALDLETGAVRWSIQLSGRIRPMAVANHVLYIAADTERHLYAIDAATGGKLWQLDVDGSNDCCVAVTGGQVYVATMTGTVYAIGGDGSSIAATPVGGNATPTPAPTSTTAPVADVDVEIEWTSDLRGMGFDPISQIAVEPRTGRIWAPEARSDTIAILDAHGKVLEHWGESGSGPGQFRFMGQNGGYGTLAFAKDGSFYVLDIGNQRIQRFNRDRKLVGQWGGFGGDPGRYENPIGIAVAPDGSVWVLDDHRSVVEHYAPDGDVLGSFDPFERTPANEGANGLAVDVAGNLYVSGVNPTHVAKFDPSGAFVRFMGDGAFTEQATDMAIDATGRIFVTQGPERGQRPGVLVFAADGSSIGGFGPLGDGDGQLIFPAGIALDGKGGIYVEDSLPDSARLVHYRLPAALR